MPVKRGTFELGHPLEGDNVRLESGRRRCRACRRAALDRAAERLRDDLRRHGG